jgi:hypothetical protein
LFTLRSLLSSQEFLLFLIIQQRILQKVPYLIGLLLQ